MKKIRIPEWLLFTMVVAIGATLRIIAASKGDFWLDEIWSYNTATQNNLLGILATKHDNNHILNTLFMHIIGESKNLFIYRSIPLLCGILSLPLIYLLPIYKDRTEKFLSLTIFSVSYFFVSYSSEARGYGYLLLFLPLSFLLLHKILSEPQRLSLYIYFWTAAIFGLLSHYLYIMFYIACFLWIISYKKKISLTIKIFLAPSIVYLGIFFLLIYKIQVGGGNLEPAIKISDLAFKDLLGPSIPAFVCFFIFLYQLVSKPKKDLSGIFYISLFMLLPMLMFAIPENSIRQERYLLIFLFFFVFILAEVISRLISSKAKIARTIGLISILLIVIFSIQKDLSLCIYGKGNYAQAVEDILNNTDNKNNIIISSDHNFRNETVFKFYLSRMQGKKPNIEFVPANNANTASDWLIYHKFKDMDANPTIGNGQFKLFKEYKHDQGLSGWTWIVYKRTIN